MNNAVLYKNNKRLKISLFQPFSHQLFKELYFANFISNIGGWMQIFATGWLLAQKTKNPSIVSLAQTAAQAPIFIFALFGGVIADRMNQSKYLMLANLQMFISAALLATIVLIADPSVLVIISLTFALGVGAAFKVSAWQTSMSSLVERDEIEAAATLHGLSFNIASILGPILGGWLFAQFTAAALYFANAISFLGLIVLYWRIPKLPNEQRIYKEHGESFYTSLRVGIKHCLSSLIFRRILMLTFALFFAISIFQSLLPIYVSEVLHKPASKLSWLMSAFGCGAVLGNVFKTRLARARKHCHRA